MKEIREKEEQDHTAAPSALLSTQAVDIPVPIKRQDPYSQQRYEASFVHTFSIYRLARQGDAASVSSRMLPGRRYGQATGLVWKSCYELRMSALPRMGDVTGGKGGCGN